MCPEVTIGKFGEIKKLMRQLSKRESFLDLEFVCEDGSILCHKFIIGAQSRFLKHVMLQSDQDQTCKIVLPGVPKDHMQIILKFLYTGRLGITAALQNIVRELLEDVLRIDAKISLPTTDSMPAASTSSNRDRDDGSSPGSFDNAGSDSQRPRKDDASNGFGPASASDEWKATQSSTSFTNVRQATSSFNDDATHTTFRSFGPFASDLPPTPPHFLEQDMIDEEDDDVVFLDSKRKEAPPLIDLSDSDEEIKTEVEETESKGILDDFDEEVFRGQGELSQHQDQSRPTVASKNKIDSTTSFFNENVESPCFIGKNEEQQDISNVLGEEAGVQRTGSEQFLGPVDEWVTPQSQLDLHLLGDPSARQQNVWQDPEESQTIESKAISQSLIKDCCVSDNATSEPMSQEGGLALIDSFAHQSSPEFAATIGRSTNGAMIAKAPSIITKKTHPVWPIPHEWSSGIVESPRIDVTSTDGSATKRKRGRPRKTSPAVMWSSFLEGGDPGQQGASQSGEHVGGGHLHVIGDNVNIKKEVDASYSQFPLELSSVATTIQRSTRTSNGTLRRQSLNEKVLFGQQYNSLLRPFVENTFTPLQESEGDAYLRLPPSLPTPRTDMAIRRGKRVTLGAMRQTKATPLSRQTGEIRKHHYSPYTITGKTFSSTLATLAEPEGVHQCQHCPATYNKAASLATHVSRVHNENLKVKCPECPKMLSTHAAIRKHLLSHRPESEWPFECPFCCKRFQAKGDLPKHFFTSKHRNDPRIPLFGTRDWIGLLNSCQVIDGRTKPKRKWTLHRRKAPSAQSLLRRNFSFEDAASVQYRSAPADQNLSKPEKLVPRPIGECILPDDDSSNSVNPAASSQSLSGSLDSPFDFNNGDNLSPSEFETSSVFIKCEEEEDQNSAPGNTEESIS